MLLLASTFGLYSALLASLTAFLAFDYFLVPPLYTFTINRWEEWIALFVFLATALLTSQLAEVMRQRTALAQRREREARILYELIRLTNSHERLEEQLSIIALSVTRVFASWGVRACALLLPDTRDSLLMLAEASPARGHFELSQDERALAVSVIAQKRMLEQRYAPPPVEQDAANRISVYSTIGPVNILRVIPLMAGDEVLGVLCLRIQHPVSWFANAERLQEEQRRPSSRANFFWTYVEQISSLVERAQLRNAALSREEKS